MIRPEGDLTRPLCSASRVTSLDRYYDGPSQCFASVLLPRGFRRLCFSLGIETTGSRSSVQTPASASRPLYAGRRPHSHQAPRGLVPGDCRAPGFDDTNSP